MKRRAARHFNDVLLGSTASVLDGRTAKRRARILGELKAGASRAAKRPLKPIDVLLRVQSLIELGEPLSSIRKAIGPVKSAPRTPELEEGLRSLHRAYGFAADAYAFVGIDEATLRKVGIRSPRVRKTSPTTAAPRKATRRTTAVGRAA